METTLHKYTLLVQNKNENLEERSFPFTNCYLIPTPHQTNLIDANPAVNDTQR